MIPFLNLHDMEHILEAARDAGATAASSIVLRLPWEVSPLFQQWLKQHVPERAERIMARVREMRGGKNYDSTFGTRMTGAGIWAEMIRQRFDKASVKLGFNRTRVDLDLTQFRRPSAQPGQASLF